MACIFNVKMMVKISTLIKACRSLWAKNCQAKGRELTPRIYSQLRRVDRRSRKISAVCSMLLRQNRSTFCRFTGSAAWRYCAWLVSKKFMEKKIFVGTNFTSWCLIAKIAKISASQKFPAIRYHRCITMYLTDLRFSSAITRWTHE